jgi:hypothetical protein
MDITKASTINAIFFRIARFYSENDADDGQTVSKRAR